MTQVDDVAVSMTQKQSSVILAGMKDDGCRFGDLVSLTTLTLPSPVTLELYEVGSFAQTFYTCQKS